MGTQTVGRPFLIHRPRIPNPKLKDPPQAMAKPNYQFEKRQRELAKKKKKEDKAQRKANPSAPGQPGPEPAETPPTEG